jgi:D-3-phosphoglycerate dehydrogenase
MPIQIETIPNFKHKVVMVDSFATNMAATEEIEELDKVNSVLIKVNCSTEDEVIQAAGEADAIITRFAPITRRVLEAVPKCKVIARYGIGYDNVDIDAATDNNILVVNTPDFCLEEVSNHVIMLILACAKRLQLFSNYAKQGRWHEWRQIQLPMASIYGQTLGLVGCGHIAMMVARKARCFDLEIIGYDPYIDKSLAMERGITLVNLPELLSEADFISVSTPATKETWHLIGEEQFRKMKPSAYFINTARGSVVNELALIKALQEKWIAGAGLDVFEKEPVDADNPLLNMDNVIVTPHTAFYSDAALKQVRVSVGQETARVLSGKWPQNVVNKTVKPKIQLG